MKKRTVWSIAWKVALVGIPVGLYFLWGPFRGVVDKAASMLARVDVSAAKGYILSFGVWAPVASFLLMVFQCVVAPLPAFIITFANAAIFGWWQGALLSWSSAMAGAALCFGLSRWYGRGIVGRFTTKTALRQVDVFFEKYGKWAVLVARLLPFVSFDVVSYAAGLTPMAFWGFLWATGLGQLPATLVYSYIGGMLTGGIKAFVYGLLILFAVSTVAFVWKGVWQKRHGEKESAEPRSKADPIA
jgi:uncharacterized membrane protein YdjX (TVP38/TMEM64 family)